MSNAAKVDDVISWRASRGGPLLHGTLSRIGDLSVTVRPEVRSRHVVLRRRNSDCPWPFSIETPEETRMRHWLAEKPEIGKNPSNGKKVVRIEMEIVSEGEQKGRVLKYEGKLDPDNIRYTKSHMVALGWQGRTSATFVDDVTKAKLVVPVEVRIAEHQGRQWPSIDRIGVYAPPIAALDNHEVADVDSWFAEVGDVPGAPPANGNGGGGGGSAGGGGLPGDEEDIPFASSDMAHDPIARPLR